MVHLGLSTTGAKCQYLGIPKNFKINDRETYLAGTADSTQLRSCYTVIVRFTAFCQRLLFLRQGYVHVVKNAKFQDFSTMDIFKLMKPLPKFLFYHYPPKISFGRAYLRYRSRDPISVQILTLVLTAVASEGPSLKYVTYFGPF